MTLSFRSRLTLRWVIGFGLVLALALGVVLGGADLLFGWLVEQTLLR